MLTKHLDYYGLWSSGGHPEMRGKCIFEKSKAHDEIHLAEKLCARTKRDWWTNKSCCVNRKNVNKSQRKKSVWCDSSNSIDNMLSESTYIIRYTWQFVRASEVACVSAVRIRWYCYCFRNIWINEPPCACDKLSFNSAAQQSRMKFDVNSENEQKTPVATITLPVAQDLRSAIRGGFKQRKISATWWWR